MFMGISVLIKITKGRTIVGEYISGKSYAISLQSSPADSSKVYNSNETDVVVTLPKVSTYLKVVARQEV